MRTIKELSWFKRAKFALRRKPAVGEPLWWRGMQMCIMSVDLYHLRLVHENPRYKVTCNLLDAQWNEGYDMWYLPGTEGRQTPKRVRGELVIPEPPAAYDWRKG